MKRLSVAIQFIGLGMVLLGASGSDNGIADKLWMAATIIGVLLMVIGRLMYQYSIYLKQERAKKSRRYRNYAEMQKKKSA